MIKNHEVIKKRRSKAALDQKLPGIVFSNDITFVVDTKSISPPDIAHKGPILSYIPRKWSKNMKLGTETTLGCLIDGES